MPKITSIQDNKRYADLVFSESTYDGNPVGPRDFPGRNPYVLTDRPELQRLAATHGPVLSDLSSLSDNDIRTGVFFIYYTYDTDALPQLKQIRDRGGIFVAPSPMMVAGKKTNYCFGINRTCHEALINTWNNPEVSHLHSDVHSNICEALDVTRQLAGDYVEIGVYRGGSALTALNYLDALSEQHRIQPRRCWLLDTFDGFTYEGAQTSIDPIWKNTHKLKGPDKALAKVNQILSCNKTPYSLHVNEICSDPLPQGLASTVVANIDVDMYEPTLAALRKIHPTVVTGGIIICEDPASTPSLYGALLAMEEFLDSPAGQCYIKIFKGAQYFLIKIKQQ